eukprot:COSAG01_NODE_1336_length_10676_cov_7.741420_6_plen_336_part_00
MAQEVSKVETKLRRLRREFELLAEQDTALCAQVAACHNRTHSELLQLPDHMLTDIAAHLSVRDLGRLERVCKRFGPRSIVQGAASAALSHDSELVRVRAAQIHQSCRDDETLTCLWVLSAARSNLSWRTLNCLELGGINGGQTVRLSGCGTDTVELRSSPCALLTVLSAVGAMPFALMDTVRLTIRWAPGSIPHICHLRFDIGVMAAPCTVWGADVRTQSLRHPRSIGWTFDTMGDTHQRSEGEYVEDDESWDTDRVDNFDLSSGDPVITDGVRSEEFVLHTSHERVSLYLPRTSRCSTLAIPQALRGSRQWRPLVGLYEPSKVTISLPSVGWHP